MTNPLPAISVIMPVYNGETYLAEAVESVLAQTFGDFEFIIIDDGSTDRTQAICEQLAKKDSRLRVISRPNTGLTPALNECIRLARAPLLARMDADDLCMPERFSKQVKFLAEHPEVVAVGTDHTLIDEAGRLLTTLRQPSDDATIQKLALEGRIAICHPAVMMRKDAVEKVGGYDESFTVAQDIDLWLRLGEVGKLANLPDVLLGYRQHEKSVSEKKRVLQMNNMRRACESAWKRRGITNGTFALAEPWRGGTDRASRLKFALRYGWWAFNSAQRNTAIHYGWRAVAAMPWSSEAWKLLVCATIKPLPKAKEVVAPGAFVPSPGTPGEG